MDRNPFTAEPAPGASAPGEGAEQSPSNGEAHGIGEAFSIAGDKFRQMGDYVSLYIAAQIDLLTAKVRKAGIYVGLGLVAVVAAAGILVTAIVLVCIGIAQGLGALFGGRMWLGDLVAGLLILSVIVGCIYFSVSRMFSAAKRNTVNKYEARKRERQARYGDTAQ